MPDRRQRVLFAALTAAATLLVMAPATATPGPELDLRDEFNDISFSGSDGTDAWLAPWVEKGEKNGPATGKVRVTAAAPCWNSYCLRIGGDDVRFAGRGVERVVDLTDAGTATLSYVYRRTVLGDDGDESDASMKVKVATAEGTFKLAVYSLDVEDAAPVTERLDLTPYVGGVVTITIKGVNDGSAYFALDDVAVTTTPAATTTTTTTTTLPPTATTTTTTPPTATTTTTTLPPTATTTTTTSPGATTTIPTAPPAGEPPPDEPPPAAPPPPPADVREIPSYSEKDDLAATKIGPDIVMIEETPPVPHLDPATRLSVVATTTAATLGVNLIPALALGLLVAWLALRGLGSRTEERRRS